MALVVGKKKKNPLQEMKFQSLGKEDSLEGEMATHSSILAWNYSVDREA